MIKWIPVLSGIIRSTLIIISIPIVVGNIICVSKHIRLLSLSLSWMIIKLQSISSVQLWSESLQNSMKSFPSQHREQQSVQSQQSYSQIQFPLCPLQCYISQVIYTFGLLLDKGLETWTY